MYRNERHELHQRKKKRREGKRCSIPMPVFKQSFVFDMAQSEEPDRKRHGFRKPMAIFGNNKKNGVGPSGDQKKFELSSSLETTCQSRASTLSRRRWWARIRNAFRRFIRGCSPSGQQAVPEVFNPRLRDRSCCLEAPACYSWPIRLEYNQWGRLCGCKSDHRCLSEAPCQRR